MAKWDLGKLKQPSPEAIVKAALERAANLMLDGRAYAVEEHGERSLIVADMDARHKLILALAEDREQVAAIISAAAQLNKAGDGNKAVRDAHKQRDEEDRG